MSNRARSIVWVVACVMLVAPVCGYAASKGEGKGKRSPDAAAESLGWQLSVQAYSFRLFTFFEAVDKAESMGLKYIEAYSKQKISADDDATTHWTMSDETKQKIQKKLADAGIKLAAYGVVKGKDDAEWRAIFEFANDMGVGTVNCEPTPEQLDTVEKLCDEFGINAAIHNHASPSFYWNPDVVLEVCKGRSKRIGACADVGHWMKSGLDPVECFKKLEGRILSMHFKDLDKQEKLDTPKDERTAHDVPWGTGVADVEALLKEAKRQGFKGVISSEYEYNWENSQPEIAASVKYFHKVTRALVKDGG
jgi:sugar phosphate isomerase/epimerase